PCRRGARLRAGLLAAVLCAAAPGAAPVAPPLAAQAAASAAPVTRPRTAAEDLQLFSQVFNQIRVNHPDSLDTHRLFMAAIQAMVQATDPHSYVVQAIRLSPQKEAEMRAGKLHPVPVEFSYSGGAAIVARIAAGTVAARQDILPGDELLAVDGRPVRAESAMELEIELAGPRGSTVTLTLERRRPDGSVVELDRIVKRERFAEESAVPVATLLDDSTGYIRITTFAADKVAEDLRAAIEKLDRTGMRRLVLDLRDNGGGSVAEAAAVAGEFLPAGTVVYTSEGRRAAAVDTGRVKRSFFRNERRYPIVVMIDAGTASASELVAGALQDHDRGVIVGQPSFGKSLMMQGFPLSDGSALVLVIGQVRTPCGRAVQRQYRSLTTREYYRAARAERDTIGRPTCKSVSGRTLYGGGGIYPDVRTPRPADAPLWWLRASELDLPLKWANQYVAAGNGLTSRAAFVEDPTLPAAALTAFRALARENAVAIPDGGEADTRLQHELALAVAYVKWGNPGLYEVEARIDPAVRHAAQQFGRFSGRP
ncbi:MAG: PDZ domain-containing protein, partial [Gemmatimonadaceae bacterium]|nr:PDZ domain-containing protein [Gemmatimonadaceae bacterium]